MAYFDSTYAPSFMRTVKVEAGQAPAIDVLPRLGKKYMPSSRAGKILVWPDNLYFPTYLPAATDLVYVDTANPANALVRMAPRFDVILAPPDRSEAISRNDETINLPFVGITGETLAIIPYYGRKYLTWPIIAPPGAGSFEYSIVGLQYQPGFALACANSHPHIGVQQEIPGISMTGSVLGSSVVRLTPANGAYDAIMIKYRLTANNCGFTPLRVTVSDREI